MNDNTDGANLCAECGTRLAEGSFVCSDCGAVVERNVVSSSVRARQQRDANRPRSRLGYVLLVLLVIVSLTCCCYLMVMQDAESAARILGPGSITFGSSCTVSRPSYTVVVEGKRSQFRHGDQIAYLAELKGSLDNFHWYFLDVALSRVTSSGEEQQVDKTVIKWEQAARWNQYCGKLDFLYPMGAGQYRLRLLVNGKDATAIPSVGSWPHGTVLAQGDFEITE